jgi:hypothetical protein
MSQFRKLEAGSKSLTLKNYTELWLKEALFTTPA